MALTGPGQVGQEITGRHGMVSRAAWLRQAQVEAKPLQITCFWKEPQFALGFVVGTEVLGRIS